MRYLKYLVLIAASLALFACGGSNSTAVGTGVINLNGGNGGTGAGGTGGAIVTMKNYSSAAMLNPAAPTMQNFSSAVHGDLRFHTGGVVNALFAVPIVFPDYGSNQAIITTNTQVQSTVQTTPNSLYVLPGDPNLYLVNSSGVGMPVTGLIVNANVTLHLPANTVPTVIPKAVVVNGTITSDGANMSLQSGSFVFIQLTGTVTTKPTTAGTNSGQLALSSGGTLVNEGIIDASGSDGASGTPGGASGGVILQADTFLYSTNIINAKGGNSTDNSATGGAGGPIQLLSNKASVAISGTVDASGGNGSSGGDAAPVVSSAGSANAIGRVSVEGYVNAIGGNGTSGNGGNGANISCTSFSGGILIGAVAITANGGNSAAGSGGAGGSLLLKNRLGTDSAGLHLVSPEGIKVAGNITLNGGNGGTTGGNGGVVAVASDVTDTALPGFNSVEFFGYELIALNGGTSVGSNGGDGGTVLAILSSPPPIVNVDIPAGGVYNEVPITAIGGDNNFGSVSKNAPGGNGGSLQFITPQPGNTVDPARTLVSSPGSISLSGGAGTVGGKGGPALISGYASVTCAGGITANGGLGTTRGGDGSSSIQLLSSGNVVTLIGVAVIGGDGAQGGNGGNVTITSGNQTNTGGIGASGGNSTTGNGGNGGTITLSSGYAMTLRLGLSVARGTGGSAANGTVKVDGVILVSPDTPGSNGIV
jgi:hypothetical protein